ncbi:MAG TPA: DoxX family protein [Chitinophagaceae bacterium]|nr:DoxX family protein [Chitinophagaceae bacterium]
MLIKILSGALMLVAVVMGLKQGYAMVAAKPEMMTMFDKWHFSKTGLLIFGLITMLSALLILHPKTFLWGNFLMAASILLIICFHLQDKDLKGVLIEIPFLLINLVLLYLHHPLKG